MLFHFLKRLSYGILDAVVPYPSHKNTRKSGRAILLIHKEK
jgi:hypothetical protein